MDTEAIVNKAMEGMTAEEKGAFLGQLLKGKTRKKAKSKPSVNGNGKPEEITVEEVDESFVFTHPNFQKKQLAKSDVQSAKIEFEAGNIDNTNKHTGMRYVKSEKTNFNIVAENLVETAVIAGLIE